MGHNIDGRPSTEMQGNDALLDRLRAYHPERECNARNDVAGIPKKFANDLR